MLLRLSNLGYQNHAMTVDNIDLTVVAKDASLLRGRDGTTNYIITNTRRRRPRREPRRASSPPRPPGEYLLYDRNYSYLDNGGGTGLRRHDDRRSSSARPAPSPAQTSREHLTATEETR